MRIAIACILAGLTLPAGRASAQEAAATPAAWSPVDQTVSDYDPRQVSLRRMEPGQGAFSRQTLFEPSRPATWAAGGLPTVGGQYGLSLPSNYIYRAPGINAMVVKPEYLVKIGPDPEDVAFNQIPAKDDFYLTLESAGMVYNLIPQLTEPQIAPMRDDWIDTRVDGRLPAMDATSILMAPLRGDGTDEQSRKDPRETEDWVDAATYFRELRESRQQPED